MTETKSGQIWEEPSGEEEITRIEAEKAALAEEKATEKAEKEAELEEKFEEAVQAHLEEKEEDAK